MKKRLKFLHYYNILFMVLKMLQKDGNRPFLDLGFLYAYRCMPLNPYIALFFSGFKAHDRSCFLTGIHTTSIEARRFFGGYY